MPLRKHDRDFVAALEKGLAIIEAFDAAVPELTLTAAARKTRLTRAGARRYLLTLFFMLNTLRSVELWIFLVQKLFSLAISKTFRHYLCFFIYS